MPQHGFEVLTSPHDQAVAFARSIEGTSFTIISMFIPAPLFFIQPTCTLKLYASLASKKVTLDFRP